MSLVRRIHHVAFAEEQGADLVNVLTRTLGLEVESLEAASGFNERMLQVGNCWLQGLEATGPGVVRTSIEKRGPGLHHIAFAVDDIHAAMEGLRSVGVEFVDAEPRPGGGGHLVAFAHPRSFGGILVELVEEDHSVPREIPAE